MLDKRKMYYATTWIALMAFLQMGVVAIETFGAIRAQAVLLMHVASISSLVAAVYIFRYVTHYCPRTRIVLRWVSWGLIALSAVFLAFYMINGVSAPMTGHQTYGAEALVWIALLTFMVFISVTPVLGVFAILPVVYLIIYRVVRNKNK